MSMFRDGIGYVDHNQISYIDLGKRMNMDPLDVEFLIRKTIHCTNSTTDHDFAKLLASAKLVYSVELAEAKQEVARRRELKEQKQRALAQKMAANSSYGYSVPYPLVSQVREFQGKILEVFDNIRDGIRASSYDTSDAKKIGEWLTNVYDLEIIQAGLFVKRVKFRASVPRLDDIRNKLVNLSENEVAAYMCGMDLTLYASPELRRHVAMNRINFLLPPRPYSPRKTRRKK